MVKQSSFPIDIDFHFACSSFNVSSIFSNSAWNEIRLSNWISHRATHMLRYIEMRSCPSKKSSSRHSHWYPCRTCWAGRARRHCCCLRLGAAAPTHLCPSHQICPPAKHSNWLQTCFKKIPFVLKIVTINCSSIYHVITSHTYFEMLSLFCSFHLLVKDTCMDGMCGVYWCRHSSTLLLLLGIFGQTQMCTDFEDFEN